ncbi:MAG: RNA-binding protein [Bdellovibrionales bacterium]|nr:RNA-binding protein [Bdellovibrionales bacterium]
MGKRLYVGNLPYSASEQDIAKHFGQVGTVESVKVVTDRDSGRSKGFCFVEMATDQEAAAAIEQMNGAKFGERVLVVSEARPREEGGRGGRGGFDRGPRY